MIGKRKRISVGAANELLQVIWPEFIEVNGCVFAAFQWNGKFSGKFEPRTETECFVNHTHILDELRNKATTELRQQIDDISELNEFYDETHPDFIGACRFGKSIARAWTLKLKHDFPTDRFRVYYTQYDNPIVRFHKVRRSEERRVGKECRSRWSPY